MAPRGGPRNSASTAGRETRSTTLNSKASSRGGISKRRSQARVDGDGDLDMGSAAAKRTNGASGGADKAKTRTSSRTSGSRGASRTAQTMLKHLSNGDSTQLASRVNNPQAAKAAKTRANAIPLTFLRVHGLKESKASRNPDGGLSDLLAFLERKATTFTSGRKRRQVSIKKVCQTKKEASRILRSVTGYLFSSFSARGLVSYDQVYRLDPASTTELGNLPEASLYIAGHGIWPLCKLTTNSTIESETTSS